MGLPPERAVLDQRHQFRDARIEHVAWALDAERRAGFPNGRLYTDSLGTALAVQLLAGQEAAAGTASAQGLTRPQLRRVTSTSKHTWTAISRWPRWPVSQASAPRT